VHSLEFIFHAEVFCSLIFYESFETEKYEAILITYYSYALNIKEFRVI
jgi:hypothetical protein